MAGLACIREFMPQTRPTGQRAGVPAQTQTQSQAEAPAGTTLDVFARPFVPESLWEINLAVGNVLTTEPTKQVGVEQFLSGLTAFLQPPALPAVEATQTLPSAFSPQRYSSYFSRLLSSELQARQDENTSYSLYAHPATVVLGQDSQGMTQGLFDMQVPGIRELTPMIEEDDVVEIRQLICDNAGRVLATMPYFASRQVPVWTGLILLGRAVRVNRRDETIQVKVDKMTASHVHTSLPSYLHPPPGGWSARIDVKVNLVFPFPKDRFTPMQGVLPFIQRAMDRSDGPDVRMSDAWLLQMLFPTSRHSKTQDVPFDASVLSRDWVDTELNWEQKKAVELICSAQYGTLPFLVSGPPGTGKTKTLIETTVQLVRDSAAKDGSILICAPSDPAADTLTIRLRSHFNPNQMFRLNRATRTFQEVPNTILAYCFIENTAFGLPDLEKLLKYKIVVTTCRDADVLRRMHATNTDLHHMEMKIRKALHPSEAEQIEAEAPRLHWTGLLLDEAAQAMEPEALIPLSLVAPPLHTRDPVVLPQVVMAGDQHQLGPLVAARPGQADDESLRTSLFARLFARPVYADHPLARGKAEPGQMPELTRAMLPMPRPAFIDLIRNYRSHPAILAVPSSLFYRDTLLPEAPPSSTKQLSNWSGWRGQKWPLLFHHTTAQDMTEYDNGGWYNPGEVVLALQYAIEFLAAGIPASEVCVMSPFKAQVRALRRAFRNAARNNSSPAALGDVDIGPTEAFQGLERTVVILCTTRTRVGKHLSDDVVRGWGIVGLRPNLLNVALTRAKSGLIIIGNRAVLDTDQNWRAVLAFCDRNGLVKGGASVVPYMQDEEEENGVVRTRLERLLLEGGVLLP